VNLFYTIGKQRYKIVNGVEVYYFCNLLGHELHELRMIIEVRYIKFRTPIAGIKIITKFVKFVSAILKFAIN
jgi:hypothetical protein